MKKCIWLLMLLPVLAFADIEYVTECPVTIVEVETPVYVEVIEYVEVEVPVYLERESRAALEMNSLMLFLYDVEIWNGMELQHETIPKAVLKYEWLDGRNMFELVEVVED